MNTKNILITGGRAPVALELARMFKEKGHNVFIAESIEYHLCKHSNAVEKSYLVPKPAYDSESYAKAIIEIILKDKIDLLIPICEEIFYVSMHKEKINQYCEVFAENLETLRILHSKWEFIKKVAKKGLSTPETYLIRNLDELKVNLKKFKSEKQVVLKPVFSRFSSKVEICNIKEAQQITINASSENPWILQEFIKGTQHCTYSIVKNGKIIAHTNYKTEYTAGKGATISFQHFNNIKILQWVENFINGEKFTGQIAFDFIENENGEIYPLECNPRATSGIHLLCEEKEFVSCFFEESNKLITPRIKTKKMLATAMLLYGIAKIRSIKQAKIWLKEIIKSKDVIFKISDPIPFFQQILCLFYFWKVAKENDITTIEASTKDIEWGGEIGKFDFSE